MGVYYVYILSNQSQVLYIGVTSDLDGRMFEHTRDRQPSSFTARYNLDRLVYYEDYPTPGEAIAREKQLKGWSRDKKKKLIQTMNPMWRNLLEDMKYGMTEITGSKQSKGRLN
jgi:putative endonuclease